MTDSVSSDVSDGDKREDEDIPMVLMVEETLALRMRYLKWCSLVQKRLDSAWWWLAFCVMVSAVAGTLCVVAVALMSAVAPGSELYGAAGRILLVAGMVSGGPIGGIIRSLLDIRREKRLLSAYLDSAQNDVVMRHPDYIH